MASATSRYRSPWNRCRTRASRCRSGRVVKAVRTAYSVYTGMDVYVTLAIFVDPVSRFGIVVRSTKGAYRIGTFLIQLAAGIIGICIDMDSLTDILWQRYATHGIESIVGCPQRGCGA